MSRESIFDPEGHQTEHSGSTFTPERADNRSHMPPDVTDGQVSEEEAADLEKLAGENVEADQERPDQGTQP